MKTIMLYEWIMLLTKALYDLFSYTSPNILTNPSVVFDIGFFFLFIKLYLRRLHPIALQQKLFRGIDLRGKKEGFRLWKCILFEVQQPPDIRL